MKKLVFIFIVLNILVNGNLTSQTDATNYKSVKATEFNQLMQSGDFVVLDIRTAKEFDEGHIENAINLDFYSKNFDQSVLNYKKNGIMIYSRSSGQSQQAITKLISLEFKNIIELENGLVGWKREGFTLIR
jgi:rhodanese-related sulfurtransferase